MSTGLKEFIKPNAAKKILDDILNNSKNGKKNKSGSN